mmetsp:Transcript_7021/g.17158  ORF Transcript_7021/g.17158 Transcript_7021/m.17158 type:complete len:201 (-) Transcript_7021:439-1041(-)
MHVLLLGGHLGRLLHLPQVLIRPAEFHLPRRVLRHLPCVGVLLLLQVFLRLEQTLLLRLQLGLRLLRQPLLRADGLRQLVALLRRAVQLLRARLQLRSAQLEHYAQVLRLLVQSLATPLLALLLGFLARHGLLEALDLVGHGDALRLLGAQHRQVRGRVRTQLRDQRELLVSLRRELLFLTQQLVHGVLLPDREPRALLD